MSIQRMTIAKIGGASCAPLENLFDRWSTQSRQIEESDGNWDESSLTTMRGLVEALRSHSTQQQLLFFAEYIDGWSVGNSLFRYLDELPSQQRYYVDADYGMAFIDLREYQGIVDTLEKVRSRHHVQHGHQQEDRWFLSFLIEAARAHAGQKLESVIVVVRDPIKGSADDAEIAAACKVIPEWITTLE